MIIEYVENGTKRAKHHNYYTKYSNSTIHKKDILQHISENILNRESVKKLHATILLRWATPFI